MNSTLKDRASRAMPGDLEANSPKTRTIILRSRDLNGIKVADYVASAGGKRVAHVSGVSRTAGQGGPNARVTLTLTPTRKADLPAGATIHPLPTKAPRKAKSAPEAPPMHPATRATRANQQKAEWSRAHSLLTDDRMDSPVASVRTKTITDHRGAVIREPSAEPHEWIDPDDSNPNRRAAKKVRGFRRYLVIDRLHKQHGLLSAGQLAAAHRFLIDYEIAIIGRSPTRDLIGSVAEARYGPSAGPTESQVHAIRQFQETRAALGDGQFRILAAIVLNNDDLRRYATRVGIHRSVASGYLLAALDRLVEHYDPPKTTIRKER